MKLAIIAVVSLLLGASAEARDVRAYVIYGQGGSATSIGMIQLASQLAKIKGVDVTTHSWKHPSLITDSIKQLPPSEPVILIGYSLGANATTWISSALPRRKIALIVAYDPSVWSTVTPAGSNVARLLLYHNNGWNFFGRARIPGPQVETTEISMSHLAIDFSGELHAQTIAAVRRELERAQHEEAK